MSALWEKIRIGLDGSVKVRLAQLSGAWTLGSSAIVALKPPGPEEPALLTMIYVCTFQVSGCHSSIPFFTKHASCNQHL